MRVLALVVAAALVAACTILPGVQEGADIVYENGSTLDVVIRVNGTPAGMAPAGESGAVPLRGVAFPWRVEAVSPAGRVLVSMQLDAAPTCATQGDATSCTGALGLVDMVCGRLAIWASDQAPSFPAPNPAGGEPCGP